MFASRIDFSIEDHISIKSQGSVEPLFRWSGKHLQYFVSQYVLQTVWYQ